MSVCTFSSVLTQGQSKAASLGASKARVMGSTVKAFRMRSSVKVTRTNFARFVTKAEVEPELDLDLGEKEKKSQLVGADREKFAIIGSGEHQCRACSYVYDASKGDPEYPVAAGTAWEQLPDDWICPTCGANKSLFDSLGTEVAGFAENQGYGLGGNSMTSGQKSGLIYGALAIFFGLFVAGYFLD